MKSISIIIFFPFKMSISVLWDIVCLDCSPGLLDPWCFSFYCVPFIFRTLYFLLEFKSRTCLSEIPLIRPEIKPNVPKFFRGTVMEMIFYCLTWVYLDFSTVRGTPRVFVSSCLAISLIWSVHSLSWRKKMTRL